MVREGKGKSIIALPQDYIVIDIETSGLDYEYNNIIEVAAIKYSNGIEVETFSSLVKPPKQQIFYPSQNNGDGELISRYIDEFIESLTGITNEMLESAPLPDEVIPAFLDFIGDSVLIGHNVHFDINFLYDAAVSTCNHPLSNNFIDTLRIARKVFPDLEHHRLADISIACETPAYNAHRAEADCRTTAACYEIMRKKVLLSKTEEDFRNSFSKKKSKSEWSKKYKEALSNISPTVEEIDDTNPIYGKVVVFTNSLSRMVRIKAWQIVANLGGIPAETLTKETNYLVIGSAEFAKSVKNGKTKKMNKAEQYQSKGQEILIVSEETFFDLISEFIGS